MQIFKQTGRIGRGFYYYCFPYFQCAHSKREKNDARGVPDIHHSIDKG